jgi:hypothetical protein
MRSCGWHLPALAYHCDGLDVGGGRWCEQPAVLLWPYSLLMAERAAAASLL